MTKLFYILLLLSTIASCGRREERTEKDLTNGEEQNISPNQTQSKEEQMKKDSTSLDLVGEDTTKREKTQ
jgi:hypothetical protein